ncbi:hypothetical protein [Maricaulis sp. CAU 1757]
MAGRTVSTGAGMGAGIAIGVALGAAFDNLGLGLALGVAFGAAFGVHAASGKDGSPGGDAANGEIDPIYPSDTPDDGSGKP